MKWSFVACWASLVVIPSVYAFEFTPTQSEFNQWDARCKKAYSATGSGRKSGFYAKLSDEQNKSALAFAEAAGGAWHYCAGIIFLKRTQTTFGTERVSNLRRAVTEIQFTARNIDLNNSWYPEVQVDLAKAYMLSDDKKAGMDTLDKLLQSHSNSSLAYTAKAYYLKKDGKLDAAVVLMQQAPESVLNQSAELNYFLGWYLMEQGHIQRATDYAIKAYALGYPVPALKYKLQAKGVQFPQ